MLSLFRVLIPSISHSIFLFPGTSAASFYTVVSILSIIFGQQFYFFPSLAVFHTLSASILKSLILMSILTCVPCLSCFPPSCLHFFLFSLSRTADNTSGHSALGSFSLPFSFSYPVDRIDALVKHQHSHLLGLV